VLLILFHSIHITGHVFPCVFSNAACRLYQEDSELRSVTRRRRTLADSRTHPYRCQLKLHHSTAGCDHSPAASHVKVMCSTSVFTVDCSTCLQFLLKEVYNRKLHYIKNFNVAQGNKKPSCR